MSQEVDSGAYKYAVVSSGGQVTNIVSWDGIATWSPPDGSTAIQATSITGDAIIGAPYSSGAFGEPATSS